MEIGKMLKAKSSMSIVRRISNIVSNVSQSVVETNISLMHQYSYRLAVIGDIEGNWEKLVRYSESSSILKIHASGSPTTGTTSTTGTAAAGAGAAATGGGNNNSNIASVDGEEHVFNVTIEGDKNKVVFLGDALDKGPNNIKIIKFFLHMKKVYGDRVILIIGNRDVNKLRFNWELSDDGLVLNDPNTKFADNRFRIADWSNLFDAFCKNTNECKVDGVSTEYTHGKNLESDRVLKLKFLLKYCMGSPSAFEDMKKELGGVPDVDVCSYYRKMVSPDGILAKYLQLAQMAYIDEATNALFVHGGVSDDSLGVIPGKSQSVFERIVGKSPDSFSEEEYEKVLASAIEKQTAFDLRKWVADLNAWGQEQIGAGIKGNMAGALTLIRYQEPKIIHDENNRSTWKGNLPTPSSIIQGRPWNNQYNLSPVDEFAKKYLAKEGISKVFFGHSPIGQVPVLMCEPFPKLALSENGITGPAADGAEFVTVACDTSLTEPVPRIGAVEVSKYGVSVRAFYYDKAIEKMIPIQAASWDRYCSYQGKSQRKSAEDHPTWRVGTSPDGKILVASYKQAVFGGNKMTFGVPEYSWEEP